MENTYRYQKNLLKALILLSFVSSGLASAEPLFIRSQALAQIFRPSPFPLHVKSQEENSHQWKVSQAWSNYWGQDKRYVIDGQTTDINMLWTHQFSKSVSFDLHGSQREFSGIPMDDIAIGFHDVFQIPQDDREEPLRNQVHFAIPDYGLEVSNEDINQVLTRSAGMRGSYHGKLSNNLFLSAGVSLFHELAESGWYPQGATDLGIQFGLLWEAGDFNIYGNGNLMSFASAQDAPIYLSRSQRSLMIGTELKAALPGLHFQALLSQSPFADLGMLSRTSYEVHLGYRGKIAFLPLEIILIENVIWPYNSPDWGVSIGSHFQI